MIRKSNSKKRLRVMEAQVIKYEVLVKVPVSKAIFLIITDIENAEEFFDRKRENAIGYRAQREFNMCRAAVNWATTCKAKIVKIENGRDDYGAPTIDFVFCFSGFESLNRFNEGFEEFVKNITI